MAQHILETDGLICPFPVQEAKAAMRDLSVGDELVIHFDCTQGTEAIPRWAAENSYATKDFVKRGPTEWSITVIKS
ncbi:oxidoreductase [Trueperella pyogenes TP8]|uniref:sulfurtransferase TusA family protein n=1 Tax=Trueperella pyogenes TaxID=1661 RepID=UPI00057E32D4|nr:sulfurtransferase TusA family protein [Trueperella pyogenes]AJC69109.1 oxidoreductase [Trueperella pyogenes TP8]